MKQIFIITLLLLSALASPILNNSPKSPLQDTDGAWDYLGVTGYSGYITMNPLTGSSIFYWLFESLNSNITTDSKPLMIWIPGGPGCSCSFDMLWEMICPIQVNSNTQPLRTNTNYTWSTVYHLMSIDFPYGAGYSFANSASDEKPTTQAATLYLYRFLYKLWVKYPSWFNRDIFIWGGSYAGHWVPGLAWNILQQNALNNGFNFNLKGIALGDPWVDPVTQTQTYASYVYTNSLVSSNQVSTVNYYQNLVASNLANGQLSQAHSNWGSTLEVINTFSSGVNVYNIRKYGDYNEDNLDAFMNKASTQKMLHVGNIFWQGCNRTVYEYYTEDIMNSSAVFLPYILEKGVQVLIYNGQDDLIVNTPGVENMIANINWPGATGFANATRNNWYFNGSIAGYVQSYQNLTFVWLNAAGHMESYDQPANVKNMAERFVNGTGWD